MDDSDSGELPETVFERRLASCSQHLALAEFAANNAINVARGYTLFYLNSGDHPIVPSILLCGGDVSSHVEAVQTMVGRMKTALEEAQANLSVAATGQKLIVRAFSATSSVPVKSMLGSSFAYLTVISRARCSRLDVMACSFPHMHMTS